MVKYKRLIMLFMALAITIISQIIISCNNDKDEENNSIEDDMTITGVENGHEYVDLGLSVSWATCNIGAKILMKMEVIILSIIGEFNQ